MGKALQFADDQTLVIVLSDHGFGSFRRGVNLNTLLLDLGLLALRDGARPGQGCRDLLLDVDWSRTSAMRWAWAGFTSTWRDASHRARSRPVRPTR